MKKHINHHGWMCCGFAAAVALLTACSDWRDGIPTNNSEKDAIAFSGTVVASSQATRANATIVKLGDTQLPTTANSGFYAGLFGCHTGQYTWQQLVGLSLKSSPTDEEKQILKENYTANLLYNAKATIGTDGTLTYEPLRFWPNSQLTSDATKHEYCTFWAYYPYNPTAEIGDYGITLIPENIGEGTGMGRVRFTMQPDAANQNDFMISDLVVNCNRDTYPLIEGPQGTYSPKPVRLRFHHMLAQVRLYAYIRGNDRMVYQDTNGDGAPDPADAAWLATLADGTTHSIIDAYGNEYEIVKGSGSITSITNKSLQQDYPEDPKVTISSDDFVALGLKVPDESKCERWERLPVWDVNHKRRRAMLFYQIEFNNIKTTTTFYPDYTNPNGVTIGYTPASTLGSATVTEYIMNPYWYQFNAEGQRDYLNDDYMFGYFEDQDAYTADGGALKYTLGENNEDATNHKHFNFSQNNILLVVPQVLDDDDVPHIVLTAKGPKAGSNETVEYTARLTINMLKMNIEWKSGIIYCYGFIDDLRPGDDIVRGPESITTIFDTDQYTDQW